MVKESSRSVSQVERDLIHKGIMTFSQGVRQTAAQHAVERDLIHKGIMTPPIGGFFK